VARRQRQNHQVEGDGVVVQWDNGACTDVVKDNEITLA
jgi:hypothetical protein